LRLRAPTQTEHQTKLTPPSPQLPFWALIVFGCYLLGRLGVAIFTFNDVPEAHAELQKEIEQAKVELRQGKIDVD
jgi:dolichyl-phosphate mannosyltransferase polypeptide 3